MTVSLISAITMPYKARDRQFCFEVSSARKSCIFATETKEQMDEWIKKIQETSAALLSAAPPKEKVENSCKNLRKVEANVRCVDCGTGVATDTTNDTGK